MYVYVWYQITMTINKALIADYIMVARSPLTIRYNLQLYLLILVSMSIWGEKIDDVIYYEVIYYDVIYYDVISVREMTTTARRVLFLSKTSGA